MLRIKIEIVPFGNEEQAHVIHTINVGKATFGQDVADYEVWLDEDPRDKKPMPPPLFIVYGHQRDQGALELSRRVLECIVLPETREK